MSQNRIGFQTNIGLIDGDKLLKSLISDDSFKNDYISILEVMLAIIKAPAVKAIPIEQLLSILPKPYNETMEDSYSQGFEDGWNACLKAIKEELDYWEKENEANAEC